MKNILVTGGLGFIGSETAVALIEKGYNPIIIDNLYNSKSAVVDRIEKITGHAPKFYENDVKDKEALRKIFSENDIDSVIHFAGYKAVGESVSKPIEYYSNNLISTLSLVEIMREFNVKNLIFSSSATVYGLPKRVPVREDDETKEATNPYGETKLMIERILTDISKADKSMNIILLRYFNPIGAHPSGLLGEDPNGLPNNLLPYISQVAIGKLDHLNVFGDDYETIDGTGVRDYIHVVDLALGHVSALRKLEENPGLEIYNLGTGKGTSVLEMVKAYETANGVKIPFEIKPRRNGDIASNYANVDKAKIELGWEAKYSVEQACKDAYKFQKMNPDGIK